MTSMKKPNSLILSMFLALATMLALTPAADAKLTVVATLADFGAIATEIGGPGVDVTVLAKPTEDPHFVDARPSFVVKLRDADVLIEGGAELELGWLPPLLQNARNEKIEVGAPGRVVASEGINLMNVPANATRAAGDVHALGNPHYMIDPIIGKAVAQHIANAFSACDAANAASYQANYKKFEATIDAKLQEWGKAMLPFKGANVVAYHDSWPYLAHRFGLTIDTFLEPKPGISPSPSHLAEVIDKMKTQGSKAILVEPFHNRKIAEKVAASTGAKVVDAGQYPGSMPNTDTYAQLIDAVVTRLAAALGGQ
jgi:zinc/manganese transport system substrate-binding protein